VEDARFPLLPDAVAAPAHEGPVFQSPSWSKREDRRGTVCTDKALLNLKEEEEEEVEENSLYIFVVCNAARYNA
jgi:hypothetical protein